MHNEYHSFIYISIKVICEQKVNNFMIIKPNIVGSFGVIDILECMLQKVGVRVKNSTN